MKQVIKKTFVFALIFITAVSFTMFEGTQPVSAAVKAPAKVKTLKATVLSQTSIKLSWSKVSKVKGYQLQRNGKVIKTGNVTTFTDKKLKAGTKYKYRVRAYKTYKQKQWYNKKTKKWQVKKPKKKYRGKSRTVTKRKYGAFSTVKTATTKSAQKPVDSFGLKAAKGYIDVTLSWNKNEQATEYKVLRDGTLEAQTEETSYKVTGLSPLTSYDFTVQALKDGVQISEASITVKTLRTPAPKNIKATNITTTSITIGWDAVAGATKYNVKSSTDSKWKRVETDTLTYTETGLSSNTEYTYSVCAYIPDEYSLTEDGTIKVMTKKEGLPEPANTKATTVTSRTAVLTWGAVSGAGGYQIYDSGMNPLDTTTACTYLVKGLKASTSYTYYIAACKNGIPSQFLSTISFKTIKQPAAWEENRNVSLTYGGVTFYLGQTWSETLKNNLTAASNGFEKVTNVQPITENTDYTTYDTTAYMFDINDYSDFLEVLVAKNRIVGWQTNGNVFGTVYGTQVKHGDCAEDYMFGKHYGMRSDLSACRDVFTDIDYGDTVVGGFGYERSFRSGDIPSIAAEKRVGLHFINAYRVKAGRCKLSYNKNLDGEQNIWNGEIEELNSNGEWVMVPISTRYGAQPMAETLWENQAITHNVSNLTKGPLAGQTMNKRANVLYWAFGLTPLDENTGTGCAGEACLSVYNDSNGHLNRILNPDLRKIGIGFGQTGYHCEQYTP